MKDILLTTAEAVKEGRIQECADTVKQFKALPRTEEGIFHLTGTGLDLWQAAQLLFPVYAAYETNCNHKEGYPDIVHQIEILYKKIENEYRQGKDAACNEIFTHTALFLDMLIDTISQISIEIYETYRQLTDIFRGLLKITLQKFGSEDCLETGDLPEDLAEWPKEILIFRNAIRKACKQEVLLTDKYRVFFTHNRKGMETNGSNSYHAYGQECSL